MEWLVKLWKGELVCCNTFSGIGIIIIVITQSTGQEKVGEYLSGSKHVEGSWLESKGVGAAVPSTASMHTIYLLCHSHITLPLVLLYLCSSLSLEFSFCPHP